MKIAIIGGGNMGEAFARGIKHHFEKGDFELIVSEKNVEKHLAFHSLEILTTTKNLEAVKHADIVVLAVKPVDMEETARGIAKHLDFKTVVVSIAAGVKIASLEQWLSTHHIVRAMPNLLASIGRSVTVWHTHLKEATTKKLVQKVLESIGSATEVDTQEAIDMATAISGCGPAYIWYFMEKMIAAGEKSGLDTDIAKALTLQTFQGASCFAASENFDPLTMRYKVASRGGATEQAIRVFDEQGLGEIIDAAVDAAYKRSVELGNHS